MSKSKRPIDLNNLKFLKGLNMKKRSVAIHVVGMALVAGTLIALNVVTLQYKGLITTHFNQTSYQIETSELDKDLDTEYYKKDFETEAELEEYNGNVCKEIEGEGLVLLKNNNNTLPLAKPASFNSARPILLRFLLSARA